MKCTRRHGRLAGGALLFMATMGLAGQAGGAEPSARDVEEARVLFDAGMQSAAKGAWERAHALFAAAWKRKQHPQIAANLGRAAFALKRYGQAAELLSYFLREATDVSTADRQATEAMLAEATGSAVAIEIAVGRPGVLLLVDDLPVGTSPLGRAILVDHGPHVIVGRSAAGAEVRREVDAIRGTENRFEVVFPEPTQAVAPVVAPPLPARAAPRSEGVDPTVVGIGAGLVALGVGIGVAGAWSGTADSAEIDRLNRDKPDGYDLDDFNRLNQRRVFWSNTAEAGFVGAGVVAIATVAYALVAGPRRDEKTVSSGMTMDLSASPGMAGLTVVQRW